MNKRIKKLLLLGLEKVIGCPRKEWITTLAKVSNKDRVKVGRDQVKERFLRPKEKALVKTTMTMTTTMGKVVRARARRLKRTRVKWSPTAGSSTTVLTKTKGRTQGMNKTPKKKNRAVPNPQISTMNILKQTPADW